MKIKIDGFILALMIAIGISYFFPQLFLFQEGKFLNYFTTVGVSLIFFFYGLKLNFTDVKVGLKNWRLHLLVQVATFILFPLLVLLFKPLVSSGMQENFWLSFFFLATLPSTVSSSVVLVSVAKGNIPAAIFNASISGLIGVLLTPLWMSFFLEFQAENVFADVYWGLICEIVIPVVLGLFLQRYLGFWAIKYSDILSKFDKTVILFIVYGSFAESFTSGIYETIGTSYIVYVFLAVLILFAFIYTFLFVISRYMLSFSTADQITAIFCGSKKSLTHGTVFSKFLFVNNPNTSLVFLPLMIYHALQIFVITIIAQRYQRKIAGKSEVR